MLPSHMLHMFIFKLMQCGLLQLHNTAINNRMCVFYVLLHASVLYVCIEHNMSI